MYYSTREREIERFVEKRKQNNPFDFLRNSFTFVLEKFQSSALWNPGSSFRIRSS